jgi:hypothetical protein
MPTMAENSNRAATFSLLTNVTEVTILYAARAIEITR